MAAQITTGARNYVLGTGSLKTALNLGFIKIYTGTAPATADAAVTGTLLTTISVSSGDTGVTLGTASAGSIPKNSGEIWSGLNVATGTAGYFRFVAAGDDGTSSTTQVRIQGLVATSGADLNLSSVNLTSGGTQTVDSGSITLPTY